MDPTAPFPRLILASASPRRADLLRAAGVEFDVAPAELDERRLRDEAPDAHVGRLAHAKAVAITARYPDRPVLGADTVVVVGQQVLGKPSGQADAARMLRLLSGRPHEVLTGVALVWPPGRVQRQVAVTTVELAPLSDGEIAWYVASGEGADKAGAYAVQGLASRFVTRVSGSYSAVVGLPVAEVHGMLREAGLWRYPVKG